ncbi:MAG: hypothetical protein MUD13_01960 [Candidatus Nanopelagicales bacterium]|jgi:hypothetical protein|nr:hypothetical protein [Candidatus Nanopelagicales bacterium]
MGGYDTGDLHRRQHQGQTAHAVLGDLDGSSRRRWRALLLPVGVLLLGLVLALWGPLPGLGVMLAIGGTMGTAITAVMVLVDGLS